MSLKAFKDEMKIGNNLIGKGGERGRDIYVSINEKTGWISFRLQQGTVANAGKNGCEILALVQAAEIMASYVARNG